MEKGFRQRNPLSPLLFNIFIEGLTILFGIIKDIGLYSRLNVS
jgi:hypothetical protein